MIVADLIKDDWFDVILLALIVLVGVAVTIGFLIASRVWTSFRLLIEMMEQDVRQIRQRLNMAPLQKGEEDGEQAVPRHEH